MAPAVPAGLPRAGNVPADPARRERSGKAARGRALVGPACRTADGGEVISDFRMIGDPAAENTTRNVS